MPRPRSDIAPRILDAARERFLREGVDGASLRSIAADAGTSIGMVYYYYPSKDDLFLGVVEEVYVALLRDLERTLAPSLPVLERLRGLYRRLGELSEGERKMVRLVVREGLASPARLDRLIARFQRGHLPLLLQLVRDGHDQGVWNPAVPPLLVFVAIGALGGPGQLALRVTRGRLAVAAPAPTASVEALIDVLLRGVGARSPGPDAAVCRPRSRPGRRGTKS